MSWRRSAKIKSHEGVQPGPRVICLMSAPGNCLSAHSQQRPHISSVTLDGSLGVTDLGWNPPLGLFMCHRPCQEILTLPHVRKQPREPEFTGRTLPEMEFGISCALINLSLGLSNFIFRQSFSSPFRVWIISVSCVLEGDVNDEVSAVWFI